MTRPALVALAVVLTVAAAAAVLLLNVREPGPALASPSPTPTSTATATPSPTPTVAIATASPSASPSPSTAATRYVNAAWGYSLVLPAPYRHSELLSFPSPPVDPAQPKGADVFTARTPEDEKATSNPCETSCPAWNYVLSIDVWTNAGSLTPREWVESGRTGSFLGQQTLDTTISGRPAVRISGPDLPPFKWVVAKGGRMYVLQEMVNDQMPVAPGATREKLDAIAASFAFQ